MVRSIVAIGGPHGSGKSSVARRLAKTLKMNYISAGTLFRKLAEERILTLEELSEIALNDLNIDKMIDERTKNMGKIDNTIVDAQLAAHFTPEDASIRISITASPEIRWARIARRDNKAIELAKQETKIREETERNRFLKLYNIDVDDLSCYDVIINNDRLSEEQTYLLCEAIVCKILGR